MKYTAITLGPIYKTFNYAKKTRELWAASYLFSYLMKNIIKALKNLDNNINITIPSVDQDLLNNKNEAGLFPDKLVFQTVKSLDKINGTINEVVEKLSKEIASHIGKTEAEAYFEKYFQVYAVQKDFDGNTTKNQIVKDLFDITDYLELQQKFVTETPEQYITDFLSKASFKNKKHHSFLVQDAYDISNEKPFKFQSIIEISAKEIIDNLDEKRKKEFEEKLKQSFNNETFDDNELIDILKDHADFRTHHKYIGILHVDGDNFGKINKGLNDDDYTEFSKSLADYSIEVKDTIKKYGGLPIYIGGDDILAFVPVRNKTKNIFSLLKEIDDVFEKHFKIFLDRNDIKDDKGNILKPSLSAGVSITYYKHPLQEALKLSRDLLFDKAKKYQAKNAVAFKVIKHSGQSFGNVFGKKSQDFNQFKDLMLLNIDEEQFFSSVIQHFFENFDLLEIIKKNPERIHNYREHFFNESFHGKKDIFLSKLEEFLPKLFQSIENMNDIPLDDKSIPQNDTEKRKNKLYAALRMIKFINREDNE